MNKLALGLLLLLAGCARGPLEVHSFQRKLMHTHWDFSLVGRDKLAAERAMEEVSVEIERLDGMLAMWQPQSEVALANASAGSPQGVTLSADLAEVVGIALQAAQASDGAFDPTVGPLTQAWYAARQKDRGLSEAELKKLRPLLGWRQVSFDAQTRRLTLPKAGMALDLGGIAKGYAQDRVAALLRKRGYSSFLLNAGGQVYAAGQKPDGQRWRVGILDPRHPDKVAAVLELQDEVLATSGDYEQFKVIKGKRLHHILDPRTGLPVANGVASSSSLLPLKSSGRAATWADINGKPVFVKGLQDGLTWLKTQGAEGVIISEKNGRLHGTCSPGLSTRLQATSTDIQFSDTSPR